MNERPASSWPFLALLLTLPACGFPTPDDGTPLAEWPRSGLHFEVPWNPESAGLTLSIEFDIPDNAACPKVPRNTKAWVNGHALELTARGGAFGDILGPSHCGEPTFSTPLSERELGLDQEVTTLEVDDGHTRFVFEALHVAAERRLVLAQPLDGVLRPGAEARVEVSVPTDTLQPAELNPFGRVAVSFAPSSGKYTESWSLTSDYTAEALTIEDGALRFTVPASAPATQGTLIIGSLSARLGVRRCEGPALCRGMASYSQEQFPMRVEP